MVDVRVIKLTENGVSMQVRFIVHTIQLMMEKHLNAMRYLEKKSKIFFGRKALVSITKFVCSFRTHWKIP